MKVICHASIYIYDPKNVIGLVASQPQFEYRRCKFGPEAAQQWLEDYLVWQTVLLMPDVWLDALAFRDEYVVWSDPSHSDIPVNAERILRSGGWKVENVRRRALMSHHMYQDILWRRPLTTLFDATNKASSLFMPIRDVVLAVVPNVCYDAGHSNDIPLLEQGRSRIRGRLDHYGMAVPLPPYVPGTIAEIQSHLDFRIQAADIAAGKARHLYENTGLLEVSKFYREVYLNGERVT